MLFSFNPNSSECCGKITYTKKLLALQFVPPNVSNQEKWNSNGFQFIKNDLQAHFVRTQTRLYRSVREISHRQIFTALSSAFLCLFFSFHSLSTCYCISSMWAIKFLHLKWTRKEIEFCKCHQPNTPSNTPSNLCISSGNKKPSHIIRNSISMVCSHYFAICLEHVCLSVPEYSLSILCDVWLGNKRAPHFLHFNRYERNLNKFSHETALDSA